MMSAPIVTPFIMPFGKYKGKPLADILHQDPAYTNWLATGADLRGDLREALNNGGYVVSKASLMRDALGLNETQSNDSFEHNKVQMRFMDVVFTHQFLALAMGEEEYSRYAHRNGLIDGEYYSPLSISFEVNGIDVTVAPECHVELKPTIHEDYPAILRQMRSPWI